MNRTGRPTEPMRFLLTAASVALFLGLGVYALPQSLTGPIPARDRVFVSVSMSSVGILLMLLIRYRFPRRARWVVLGAASFAFSFGAARSAIAGLWPLCFLQAALVCVLFAVALLPRGIRGDRPDFTFLFLATTELCGGVAMIIRPERFMPPVLAAIDHPVHWIGPVVVAGGLLLTLRRNGTRTRMWRFGPLRVFFYARPFLAAVLPALMIYESYRRMDIEGLLAWVIFLAAVFWPRHALMLGPAGDEVQASKTDVTDAVPSLDRTLELWTWLLALAVVSYSAFLGAPRVDPSRAEQFFVLGLVAWNILTYWVLRGRILPRTRLLAHLIFLTVTIGLLHVTAGDPVVAYVFAGVLLVIPSLFTRAFGARAGWILLGATMGIAALSGVKAWGFDDQPAGRALGESVVEILVLALAGGMGVRSAGEQRRLVQGLAARAADLARAEDTLRESEERFRSAFAHAAIGKALIRPDDGRFLAVNRTLCEMFGYSEAELLRMIHDDLLHPAESDARAQAAPLGQADRSGYLNTELRYMSRRGEEVWAQVTVSPAMGADGQTQCLVAEIQDITERKQVESQLVYMADHDPLTNLVNRRRFREDLARQLEPAGPNAVQGAVIFLDLDNFKEVNDTLGHAAGDQVLVAIAGALKARLRGGDVLARLGGDEFAVLLPGAAPDQAESVARKILSTVAGQVTVVGDQRVRVTASLGIAAYPRHGQTPEDLLKRADIALFRAKESRNCYAVYRPDTPLESLAIT